MERYPNRRSNSKWDRSNPNDYHHVTTTNPLPSIVPPPAPAPPLWDHTLKDKKGDKFAEMIRLQMQMLAGMKQCQSQTPASSRTGSSPLGKSEPVPGKTNSSPITSKIYNPFVEDSIEEDMEISDEENKTQDQLIKTAVDLVSIEISDDEGSNSVNTKNIADSNKSNYQVKSGAAFYKGLILYIPPFEQLAHTYRGSPAMKMLYASFEFSFKMPIKIETKPSENSPKVMDATVLFQDNVIAFGSGKAPHVEASVRALELLSETCYTIQAKEDYFLNCKLIDAENMKTLNLKKWEAVSQKHPKIVDVTNTSHIQKTIAVFLDNHTSTGLYNDIICCNLTRQDVNNIKGVVEFFQLTMLPCSVSTNLSKKHTPCVVAIQKYTSAKNLLDILVECGGENDNFKLYPPDTFKDFYKLHQNFWDPNLQTSDKTSNDFPKTTVDTEDLQTLILKPYENTVAELFEKHKLLPKVNKNTGNNDTMVRKEENDVMKEKLQIDMTESKNAAPVERMQLLLKYMEQLQEYGSRVLTSGRSEMIKIYHNAIENLRKDLDSCRKDIEKEQKATTSATNKPSRSPQQRKSKSPVHRNRGNLRNRSVSPRRRIRSRSPKRVQKPLRSLSPRRKSRSKSPRRKPTRTSHRTSPARRIRSPPRKIASPPRRAKSPRPRSPRPKSPKLPTSSRVDQIFASIFKDQFRRYGEILRRFRIEIENTPIERRHTLQNRWAKCNEQLEKFHKEAVANPSELGAYLDEIVILKEELSVQSDYIWGKPGPYDLPQNLNPPPPWLTGKSFESVPIQYPLPRSDFGARIPPPHPHPALCHPNYNFPFLKRN